MSHAAFTPIHLHTSGGGQVAARVFEPPAGAAAAMQVVIGPAMGVPQQRYADFAAWLAGQGARVLTFDYRGQFASLALLGAPSASLRGVQATLDDWRDDYEAAVAWLHARGAAPLLIGHSMGAQLPGLFAQPQQVGGLLMVAAGSGYWRENAPALRLRALLMWHALVPVLTPLWGYFPGKRLGAVGDLPAGVIRQWRRWCLHPRYSGAEGPQALARYARVRYPIRALSVADDEMMTLQGTQSLLGLYAGAPRQLERVAPADHGLSRIGHLGWFHPRFAGTLWPHTWQALRALAASPPQGNAGAPTV